MKREDSSARQLQREINYTEIVQSTEFQALLEKKKRFIIPMSIFFFSFFHCLTDFNIVFKSVTYKSVW